jgi:hypothetical protein
MCTDIHDDVFVLVSPRRCTSTMYVCISGAFAFGDGAMQMSRSLVPTPTPTPTTQSLKNHPIEGVGHQEVAAHSGNGLQNCVTVRSAGGGHTADARVRSVRAAYSVDDGGRGIELGTVGTGSRRQKLTAAIITASDGVEVVGSGVCAACVRRKRRRGRRCVDVRRAAAKPCV